MKERKGLVIALVLALGAIGTAGISVVLAEDEEVVSLDQVPAAVRTTIEQHAGQHPIAKIERETENGAVVYEVEQRVNGQEVEFQVSASGEYLGPEAEEADDDDDGEEDDAEENVAWDELPKAVQDGLATALGGATPEDLARELEHGLVTYEAEYEANGAEYAVKVSDNGNILESEERISAAELPAAVVDRLAHIAPNAEINEVELVTVTFYEIELKSKGKTREMRMFANGQRLDDDD